MKKINILSVSLACALNAAFAAQLQCPRWMSVMPLHEGCEEALAKDAADLGNTTFVDGILWMCAVHPEGDPATDKAAMYVKRYKAASRILRGLSDVRQGILLQATMGHGGFPGTSTPWQLAVKADGNSVYRMCPMDERFLEYISHTCRTFAAAKPDFFMVDDDTRLIWGETPGCFCPLHLAEFSKRTRRSWTRQEVVSMLKKGVSRESDIWEAVKIDSLRRFFKVIRDSFGGDIPGSLCVCNTVLHQKYAKEFAEILAAPGQTPIVRGAGAPYHAAEYPKHVAGMRCSYSAQLDRIGKDVIYMQEADTCPHTLWATSAVRSYEYLVMLALEGCKGAKIWITRTGNYGERKSAEAYRRMFRENRGLMEWAAKTDFRQEGIVVPACGTRDLNFGDRYLALTGIPYRFGKARKGEVTALTTETLVKLPRETVREILSGIVILDGPAAIWLTENGFSGDIGVKAKKWARKTVQVHQFEDGSSSNGMRTGGLADLSDMAQGARVYTKLMNRPRMGETPVYEAPGSVVFENARGGKVLVFAQPLPVQAPRYFEAPFFSETYKAAVIRWLTMLGGRLPGGVCYLGVGHMMCESGTTSEGEKIIVLDSLDLDGDTAPEFAFESDPAKIERLQGNGSWVPVKFQKTKQGSYVLDTEIRTHRPAIFRWTETP